jgi:hypothetical protein
MGCARGAAIIIEATMNDIEKTRARIDDIEQIMLAMPQVDVPVDHVFGAGLYARTIVIPAGVTLTGKIHLYENLNILIKGRVVVQTEDGTQKEMVGPYIFVAQPGTKRIGHVLEEATWVTIEKTTATNEADALKELIVDTREQYQLAFEGGIKEIAG